jgi:shikimate dehydrogenase
MSAPDQYGVVGHPISHSWSPFIHGLFAKQTDQFINYRLYDIAPENFRAQVLEFFTRGGRGLNVTVPHKEAAAELANELTPRADRAGAVNTLILNSDHTLLGDNTDGHGLVTDLRTNLGLDITNERMLILGAGGATRGVTEPLLALGPTELVIANRTPERAINLASLFSDLGAVRGCGFEDVGDEPFDIVINATAAGLSGSVPNVASGVIARHTVCYDMSYSKSATPFVSWAIERGCARAHKGWGMLVEQAAESFTLWRGVRPDTEPVLAALGMK